MKAKWFLDSSVTDPHYQDPLFFAPRRARNEYDIIIDILKSLDMDYKITKFMPFHIEGDRYSDFEDGDCVIPYGSTGFLKKILFENHNWQTNPTEIDNFNCSYYYEKYKDFIINKDYEIIQVFELLSDRDKYFEKFHNGTSKIFVRPNVNDKLFNGGCINYFNVTEFFSNLALVDDDTLIVVSSPKEIKEEYRFFIVDGKISSGSKYREDGIIMRKEIDSDKVLDFANMILKTIPEGIDDIYVMDIGNTNGNMGIVEFNWASCAGFYKSDVEKIVIDISEFSYNKWISSKSKKD